MATETPARPADDLETAMRSISRLASATALTLMAGGLAAFLFQHPRPAPVDGPRALALGDLMHQNGSGGLVAMSLGIIALALLPTARVVLAGALYARRRRWTDAAVALLVVAELLYSAVAGR
jgi:hypothetical protein